MTVSTHVLDAGLGRPAGGVSVVLARLAPGGPGGWLDVEASKTDADGRHRFVAETPAGTHRLTFATGPYFAALGVASFYPEVAVTFTIPADAQAHFHVPLLLSPFAYSTYRGS